MYGLMVEQAHPQEYNNSGITIVLCIYSALEGRVDLYMKVYLQMCMKNDKCFLPVIHCRAYRDSPVYLRNSHNGEGIVLYLLGLQFTQRHQGPTRAAP